MTVAGADTMRGGGGAVTHRLMALHALRPGGRRRWTRSSITGVRPADRAHRRGAAGRTEPGLGAIGEASAIPALKEALRNEKVESTYNHIMDALIKLGCDDLPAYELPMLDMETDSGDTDHSEPFDIPRKFLRDADSADEDDLELGSASLDSIPIL